MKTPRGVFIGQRKDRMGARLLMMLTCIRLAEDFEAEYKVNWFPQGSDAPELDRPEELFTQEWMEDVFLNDAEYEAASKDALPIWSFLSDAKPDRLNAHLERGRSVLVDEGFEVIAFPWEDIEAIRPRYRGFIHRIGFIPRVRAIMALADEKLSGQGVSAYHIRRGDILNESPWKHTTWPAKVEPEELYDVHLEQNMGRRAIMFSDQPELIQGFQARFPDLLQMSDIADLSDLTRAQRDFLELYAMSRADHVIAPFISAFSMAAARISGRQRKVFRDVLSEQEIKKANDRVIRRVATGPRAFLNVSEAAHVYAKAAQYLCASDQYAEAYDLAKPILEAESDNAFMPLLQALNCFYLSKWKEGEKLARTGLENPHLWPEDYAVLCALLGAILGAQKKRWSAGRFFAQAFWAKPLRPDVIVLGSRMVYRDQLPYRLFPPTDWGLQKEIRQRRFPPFNSLYLVQNKVIVRQPCNLDMILLDWSDLALDQKARRLQGNQSRLTSLAEGLSGIKNAPEDDTRVKSLYVALNVRMGAMSNAKAIDVARQVVAQSPDNPLYRKRLSELYETEGDFAKARLEMAEAVACDPDNAFLVFAMGQYLVRSGSGGQGEKQILQAADLDDTTPSIQGAAGQIHLRRGNKGKAKKYLRKAHELFPPFKRFANQLERAES